MSIHSRAGLCEPSNSPYFDGAYVTLVAKSQAQALALALALFDALELYSGRSLRPSPKTCLNAAKLRVLADAKAITKAMPAKDLFHDAVRHALEKEGWIITDDRLHLDFGGVEIYIDLGAEKLLAAERNGQKIAVAIKSFIKGSAITEFHAALGQFINYRTLLKQKEPERELYLAAPVSIYEPFCDWS